MEISMLTDPATDFRLNGKSCCTDKTNMEQDQFLPLLVRPTLLFCRRLASLLRNASWGHSIFWPENLSIDSTLSKSIFPFDWLNRVPFSIFFWLCTSDSAFSIPWEWTRVACSIFHQQKKRKKALKYKPIWLCLNGVEPVSQYLAKFSTIFKIEPLDVCILGAVLLIAHPPFYRLDFNLDWDFWLEFFDFEMA